MYYLFDSVFVSRRISQMPKPIKRKTKKQKTLTPSPCISLPAVSTKNNMLKSMVPPMAKAKTPINPKVPIVTLANRIV